MFLLTNVRPIKSSKKANTDQRFELSYMSEIRRAKSKLTLRAGSEASFEHLASLLKEAPENLHNVLAKRPAISTINNEVLQSQYLSQRISDLLSKLTDHENEVIVSHFAIERQACQIDAKPRIAYLAERRLKKLVPQRELGNFLA